MTYSLRFELLCNLLNDQGSFDGQNILPPGFHLTDPSDQLLCDFFLQGLFRFVRNKLLVVAAIQELNVDHLTGPSDQLLTRAMQLIVGH
jgi:hypothetical protein